MNAITVLPLAGGSVALFSGVWFLLKKGLGDNARTLFFVSLLSLGLFGLFETMAYMVESKETARILIQTGWSAAILAPYFIMSFATLLRGESGWHKIMIAPAIAILIYDNLFIVTDMVRTEWGWSVVFLASAGILSFLSITLFMSIGIYELFKFAAELEAEKSPLHRNVTIMTYGFIMWLLLALVTNGITVILNTGSTPLFSFMQLFPSIIVVYGFTYTNGGKKKK